jgi:hypothetical protein
MKNVRHATIPCVALLISLVLSAAIGVRSYQSHGRSVDDPTVLGPTGHHLHSIFQGIQSDPLIMNLQLKTPCQSGGGAAVRVRKSRFQGPAPDARFTDLVYRSSDRGHIEEMQYTCYGSYMALEFRFCRVVNNGSCYYTFAYSGGEDPYTGYDFAGPACGGYCTNEGLCNTGNGEGGGGSGG